MRPKLESPYGMDLLVQTIDLAVTILEYFDVERPSNIQE